MRLKYIIGAFKKLINTSKYVIIDEVMNYLFYSTHNSKN